MTLIQKLPLGLALAGCMFLSSCSQEDMQMAKPRSDESAISPNPNRGFITQPYLPTTNGATGDNVFPAGWAKWKFKSPDDPVLWAAGSSSFTHLWGNQSSPWKKPLPIPAINASSILTFMAQQNFVGQGMTASMLYAKITNLTPGKKYSINLQAASSVAALNGETTEYGQGVGVYFWGTTDPSITVIDLKTTEAKWVNQTLIFEPLQDEIHLYISSSLTNAYVQSHPKFYHFYNVFVDKNSIKQLL